MGAWPTGQPCSVPWVRLAITVPLYEELSGMRYLWLLEIGLAATLERVWHVIRLGIGMGLTLVVSRSN